jgi:hypothetical protein
LRTQHLKTQKNLTEWSAYRFHEMDPLRFEDGLKFQWRCGDLSAPSPNVSAQWSSCCRLA